jgi:hypothetical protein
MDEIQPLWLHSHWMEIYNLFTRFTIRCYALCKYTHLGCCGHGFLLCLFFDTEYGGGMFHWCQDLSYLCSVTTQRATVEQQVNKFLLNCLARILLVEVWLFSFKVFSQVELLARYTLVSYHAYDTAFVLKQNERILGQLPLKYPVFYFQLRLLRVTLISHGFYLENKGFHIRHEP